MEKYISKILEKKDLYIETGIYREYDSPSSVNLKLYRASITHVPSRIKSCYISEINPIDAYNTALQQLEEKVSKLSLENLYKNMTHLSKEGQKEYDKIVDSLYEDTGVTLF